MHEVGVLISSSNRVFHKTSEVRFTTRTGQKSAPCERKESQSRLRWGGGIDLLGIGVGKRRNFALFIYNTGAE
mgnify:CR=1 FL=1